MTTKSKTIVPGLALAASILGLAFAATPSYALTPPALEIAVTGGPTLVIDSTGTCYSALTPTPVTETCPGTVTLATSPFPSITWSGTLGSFTFTTLQGEVISTTNPLIDLGVKNITTGATGGTVTLSYTATKFAVGESPGTFAIGATTVGTSTYTAYVDNTDAAFGTGTTVESATTNTTETLSGGPGPKVDPFSMTIVQAVTLGANSAAVYNTDVSMSVAPEAPLALACGASTGQVGTPYSSNLVATGGVPAYTYSISGGPSWLSVSSTTGALAGTPTASGTISFTAKVADSSGNTGFNTATASCSIVVTTSSTGGQKPPLTVTCPTSTATVGVYYSSTVPITGGTPPYKYTIILGALPDGLSFNVAPNTPFTGPLVISGTPTAASQTGAFKIEITDSTGTVVYTNCSGSCSNGVTVTYGGTQNQNGWGEKGTSYSYTSNGLPLNVYGFTTSGVPNNLYTSNSSGGTVLGLANGWNQNQVDTQHFVQFDISAHNASGATGGLICVTSLDWNASYDVYGSNSLGSRGTLLAGNVPANTGSLQNIPNCNKYKYISVCAHQGDVQVCCLQFTYTCACAIDVGSPQGNQGGQGGEGNNPGNCGW
jgi:hypothetical protein